MSKNDASKNHELRIIRRRAIDLDPELASWVQPRSPSSPAGAPVAVTRGRCAAVLSIVGAGLLVSLLGLHLLRGPHRADEAGATRIQASTAR